MQTFKERNIGLIKILAVLLMILACCNLPSLLFWPLCLKEDLFRPFNTEVLISACRKSLRIVGTPDGEALFVGTYHDGNAYLFDSAYLLDLRTGENKDVPNDRALMQTRGEFLSSELVWMERGDYDDILDLTDGQRYELIDLGRMLRFDGGKFDSKYYHYFQSAEQVFIIRKHNTVIALPPNFREHPEARVILNQYALGPEGLTAGKGELLEKLMKSLGVKYEITDLSLYYTGDIFSPTGKYVVRNHGIYLSGTNTPVLTHDMYSNFRSWYYDESGVVVQERGSCLIEIDFIESSAKCLFYVPGPVLKLRLPGR